MIKRYDLINVPCHGGWDSYGELQEVEDGDWVRYDDHAAEVERLSTEGLHLVALSIATSNALPDLLAELHTLRARVAELERTTPSLEWIDLRPAHEPMREMLALSYEQGRRDALRGVQGACLFEMGRLEEGPREYRGESWDWEGYPEEMRAHDALREVVEAAEEAARAVVRAMDDALREEEVGND